jgi:hypothetical protein
MQSETAKTSAAHHDFLSLWKDADRNVPIPSLPSLNMPFARSCVSR